MNNRKLRLIVTTLLILLLFTSCLPGDGAASADKPSGFFMGIWHGWMAPLSLIIGLFSKTTRVYEVFNTGWWYDLGFYMAVISGFGGLSLGRNKQKKKKD